MRVFCNIIILVAASSAHWLKHEKATQCPVTGIQCSQDCKNVVYCANTGGDFTILRECPTSTYCSTKSGSPECDADSCPGTKPICAEPGAMPDPTDCQVWYNCAYAGDADPLRITCPDDEIFDTKTLECVSGVECRAPVKCANAGDYGILDADEKIFCFYCIDINLPFVLRCSGLPSMPPETPQCSAAGQFFPDPSDCHKYFICHSAEGNADSQTCPEGKYFSPEQLDCVKGECQN